MSDEAVSALRAAENSFAKAIKVLAEPLNLTREVLEVLGESPEGPMHPDSGIGVNDLAQLQDGITECRHDSSPSLDGLDNLSVGDGAGPGDELRAHTSGPVGLDGGDA